jgi:hypothetical protein
MRVAPKVMLPIFLWDATAIREMKLAYISIQVFTYLQLFFYIVTSTFYTCPPVLNKTPYPSVLKVIISLSKPLLSSCDDCIFIREALPSKSIFHRTKQMKICAKSGLKCGCGKTVHPNIALHSHVKMAVWGLVLSC